MNPWELNLWTGFFFIFIKSVTELNKILIIEQMTDRMILNKTHSPSAIINPVKRFAWFSCIRYISIATLLILTASSRLLWCCRKCWIYFFPIWSHCLRLNILNAIYWYSIDTIFLFSVIKLGRKECVLGEFYDWNE